jgi:ferredoxin
MGATESSANAEWPVPIVDPARCNGCGLCVKACPTGALAMTGSLAIVARPDVCEYTGYCERICPIQAITRPFQVIVIPENEKEVGMEQRNGFNGSFSDERFDL